LKIPKKLKVSGHWYTVKYPYKFSERGDLKGQHDGDLMEIRISATDGGECNRPESDIAATFLHEILHAVDRISGHYTFVEDENALKGLTEILFQVLRDNKLRFDEEN
jgi:hypothetical protein